MRWAAPRESHSSSFRGTLSLHIVVEGRGGLWRSDKGLGWWYVDIFSPADEEASHLHYTICPRSNKRKKKRQGFFSHVGMASVAFSASQTRESRKSWEVFGVITYNFSCDVGVGNFDTKLGLIDTALIIFWKGYPNNLQRPAEMQLASQGEPSRRNLPII